MLLAPVFIRIHIGYIRETWIGRNRNHAGAV
jgi:hypothetical protein